MRYFLSCAVLFGLAISGGAAQVKPKTPTKSPAKAKPMSSDFDRMFQNRDWSAVELSQRWGPSVVPFVEPYLRDPDELKRLLAVDCIGVARGSSAPHLLLRMLSDSNEQVRNNAVNALRNNLPVGEDAALMAAWDADRTRDGYVRQQIPLLLGLIRAQSRLAEMNVRMKADPRQEVRDGMVAGAAKLGDPAARNRFGELLRDARGPRTAELIELVQYLDEPWVIPKLVPVLARRDEAQNISTHLREVIRRDCDLAVDEVIRISKAHFSFPANPLLQYREEQIAEVMRYAQTH